MAQYGFKWGHSAFSQILGGAHAPVLAVGIYLNSLSDAAEAKSGFETAVRSSFDSLGHTSDEEAWRARMYGRAETLLARWESLGSRNEMFADFLMFDTTQELIIGRIAELQKSSPDAVRALSERWLQASQARYLVVEPSGTVAGQRGKTYAGGAEAHATAVEGVLADQPLPTPEPGRPLRAERYKLDNGLTVMLWPYGSTPVVRGKLIIDSGSAHDPKGKEGLSALIGATDVQPDSVEFEQRELSIFVDNLVVELGVELRSPGLPLTDDAKDFVKARLRNKRAAERLTYDLQMRTAVYGETHPYARPSMTETSVDQLQQDLVNDWARGHLVGKNATLIITGQFDAELVKKHIAYNVDQVRAGSDSNDITFDPPPAVPKFVTGTAAKPSPTVELDLEFLSAPGLDDNYAKRLVLEVVLDAELSKLRDKEALTYGFYAGYAPHKGGGLWRIGGNADASRAAEAARYFLSIMDRLRADAESYRGSFVLARQRVIERLLAATTDSSSVAGQLAAIARFDLEDSFFDGLAAKVAKLTLQDFHRFLTSELPATRQVFGAFGNADAAKAAVEAAGGTIAAAVPHRDGLSLNSHDTDPPVTLRSGPPNAMVSAMAGYMSAHVGRDYTSVADPPGTAGLALAAKLATRLTGRAMIGFHGGVGILAGNYKIGDGAIVHQSRHVTVDTFGFVEMLTFDRVWAAGLLGLHWDRTSESVVPSWNTSLAAGVELSVDVLRYERHRLAVTGHVDWTVFSDNGYYGFTLGLTYRQY